MIIDAHRGVGHDPHHPHRSVEAMLGELLEAMDRAGIDHSVLGPTGPWAAVDNIEGNDTLLAWSAKHPDRLSALATANPWYGTRATETLRRAFDHGARGLRIAPSLQGFGLLSPVLEPLLGVAGEYRRAVYVVTGLPVVSEPLQLAELALRHPAVTFVMGRSGRTDFSLDLDPAFGSAPNLLAETAYNGPALIADLVRKLGAERIMFTTDAPLNEPVLELSRLARASLTATERSYVMARTAARIYDLEIEVEP